jgi:hypothetical protein
MSPKPDPMKFDFTWVKNKVTGSLDDESKLLWSSMLKWLEDNGEGSARKQLEVSAEILRNEGLLQISELRKRLPVEE